MPPRPEPAAYFQQAKLTAIEQQVRQPLSDTTLGAIVQVTQLARDCRWLLDHTRGDQ
ncbi:DUF6415 family natural product biosynthesis protein [Streptomyces sp. NPDC050610]|uniref:DUF6415 family natural product biosynthesis protein n=1 Tax=Streptomyces sp. NPDC050610 TaxID=3157097 RepID=UPI00344803F2